MNTIKELLLENGYAVTGISEAILNKIVASDTVRVTGKDKCDLFKGFELSSHNDNKIYTINLEDNEFTQFCIQSLDADGYIITEDGYDSDLTLIYSLEI